MLIGMLAGALIIVVLVFLMNMRDAKVKIAGSLSPTPTMPVYDAEGVAQAEEEILLEASPTQVPTGLIKGKLSYPSEGLPKDLMVCAVLTSGSDSICTQNQIPVGGTGSGMGYELTVPAGTYYVHAYTETNPTLKAYYSEFVTCGLLASCPSHKPIMVDVKAGETAVDVDPGDWYAPQE